tara:strand:- start:1757 stop:2080 length:324 start_codon:yes stop_codon:yes gene_type:complete
MFGRKKKEEEQEYHGATIEVDDDDAPEGIPQDVVEEVPIESPPVQQVESSLPSPEQIQSVPAPVQKTRAEARIEAAEIINHEGKKFYRFVLLTNKSIGEVGEILPLN